MNRKNAKTMTKLGDEELTVVTGGALVNCSGLLNLKKDADARGDAGMSAFFQGALNGAGKGGQCRYPA